MPVWFGPKSRYDFGVASWQGWLVVAVLMTALWALRLFFKPELFGLPHWAKPAATGAVVLAFSALIYVTYDRNA